MEAVSWLEVVDRRTGAVERRRLEHLPLRIGRGWGCDVVVDDPQVCPEHLELTTGPDGALEAIDLGSVNGLWVARPDGAGYGRVARAPLDSGAALRIGRTTLRFYAPSHGVAPTVRDEDVEAGRVLERGPASEPGHARWIAWLGEPKVAALLTAAAFVVMGVSEWLGSYDRTTAPKLLGAALAGLLALVAYAGGWAFVGRVVVQRFAFRAHLAIGAAAFLAFSLAGTLGGYLDFMRPESELLSWIGAPWYAAVVVMTLGAHFAHATGMRRRARWVWSGGVVGVVALFGVIAALEDDPFSTEADFDETLRGVGAEAVQVVPVAALAADMARLKGEVDTLVIEADRKR